MTSTWDNVEKSGAIGGGWNYNEVELTYEQITDLETGNTVYYEALGLAQNWINQSPKATTVFSNSSKTSSTWNNQTKN